MYLKHCAFINEPRQPIRAQDGDVQFQLRSLTRHLSFSLSTIANPIRFLQIGHQERSAGVTRGHQRSQSETETLL